MINNRDNFSSLFLKELNKCKTELQYWRSKSTTLLALPSTCASCSAPLTLPSQSAEEAEAELKALANQGIFLTDENLMETTTEAALQVWVTFFLIFWFLSTINDKYKCHPKNNWQIYPFLITNFIANFNIWLGKKYWCIHIAFLHFFFNFSMLNVLNTNMQWLDNLSFLCHP